MPAYKPEEVHELFTTFFTVKDLDGMLSLYEPNAVFAPQSGIVSGQAAIREALRNFLALKAQFTLQLDKVLQTDDLALLISSWTLSGTDPNGNAVELAGKTSDVVRRQHDGTWLLVIDNPYGTA